MPESWLQDWRSWGLAQAPRLLHRLPGGRTNTSYLVEASGQRLVLRHNYSASAELGIDRERERKILVAAAAAGIAPQLVYCDDRVMLAEYIDGDHWHQTADLNAEHAEQLLSTMARVHRIRLDLPRYDYLAHIEAYWRQLPAQHSNMATEHDRMLPLLHRFQEECRCHSLCHHDPLAGNVIASGNRLYLIDWEYAGMGCRAFDFAALADHWGGAITMPKLDCDQQLAGLVYRYLCRLWETLRGV